MNRDCHKNVYFIQNPNEIVASFGLLLIRNLQNYTKAFWLQNYTKIDTQWYEHYSKHDTTNPLKTNVVEWIF